MYVLEIISKRYAKKNHFLDKLTQRSNLGQKTYGKI